MGREIWSVSRQPFAILAGGLSCRDEADGDFIHFGSGLKFTDTNCGTRANVAEAASRMASSLVVDQAPESPAALRTAPRHAGLSGSDMLEAGAEVLAAYALNQAAAGVVAE
ncbi:hypothetical protein Rmf_39370 [Roseomonas fluvialis]|uniref:Uncharacterized protein n=1 Tax=Roseomonas fluvialis TaxID=1750527 RepID=A0ABM7Y7Y4_9PROT|nr:hypothetical protein Rmf_39370 [Roseomonas fluvialis]